MDIMCYSVTVTYTDGTRTITTFDNQNFMGEWLRSKDMDEVDHLVFTPERFSTTL